jgi:malonyl-CoA/methylmalonyl-CoA synthetase
VIGGAPGDVAVRVGDEQLTYAQLRLAAGAVAARLSGAGRAAVETEPDVRTVVAIVGALAAGVAVVPVNPKAGDRERGHVLGDCAPDVHLAPADVDLDARAALPAPPSPDAPALIVYTSGTTGLPKGVVLAHRAITSNLAAIATAWAWSGRDRVVHALPLSHVHGLVLGTLGPIRLGGTSHHVGAFSPEAIAAAGGSMVFGVPTMWGRIAEAAERDGAVARALGATRLLVSGSAGLPTTMHERLLGLLGRRVVERYGMTETLFQAAERVGTVSPPGSVGPPLAGVAIRLADDAGVPLDRPEPDELGEVQVRSPSLFDGYLGLADATAAAHTADGWFRTGDIGAWRQDGSLRLLGRRSGDLIKSGGYRIGAGEIETCLQDHQAVVEVAVTGEPDPDLGERIVAWVVCREPVDPRALVDHVASQLAPHKRPREVRFLEALPRNEMGKVRKAALPETAWTP